MTIHEYNVGEDSDGTETTNGNQRYNQWLAICDIDFCLTTKFSGGTEAGDEYRQACFAGARMLMRLM
ncbi:uncharacterized protein Bfra_012304 [Botrytis fragariae]|uniref:Uncharacterized protein n=1 Tax=Botrytis fragariae TaxID=1964551 RepID=A0A8H6AJW1_9HELO|nr:uncharacterized protein Bfra_012304 [Botrytis fragariae]KAF5868656.1 hypothetical protein Bfra_012304 [Botrytis fragariae]